jgi:hypothetical protein
MGDFIMDLRKTENKQKVFWKIANEFDKVAKKKNNKISLIDVWDVEFIVEKKFGLTSEQSQNISHQVLNKFAKLGEK